MYKRVTAVFLIVLLLMGGLMLRLYDLSGRSLRQAAERQAGTTVTVAHVRGTIYDSRMRPLVNEHSEYRVAATANPKAIAALAGCVDEEALETLTARLQEGRPVVSVVKTLPSTANGLAIFEVPVRYGEPLPAPHIVGYLDGSGVNGATGAEKVFNDLLNQYAGNISITYTADAMGRPLEGIPPAISNSLRHAQGGIALTIDKDIQQIAEESAKAHISKGAVVIMEPATGRIAAMVSLPDFQLSTLADSLHNPDSPLINRALSNYNAGSVFKIVTAAAALESGITPSAAFFCNGSADVGDVTFHCHHRLGHGSLTMRDAFAQSCNPYFIRLALQTGGKKLYNMATALGFDRSVILTEGWKTARGVLPSEAELLSPAATANLAFGQGVLMASPVHIAQLVATVINHGEMVRPTLLKGIVDEAGNLTEETPSPAQAAFSASTARVLREMMVYAVEEGTGASARPIAGGAGGKTGTAETGWMSNGSLVLQGWFAGFYPAQDPEYVIVVLAEDTNGTGGKAAPVFKEIGERLSMLKKARALESGSAEG